MLFAARERERWANTDFQRNATIACKVNVGILLSAEGRGGRDQRIHSDGAFTLRTATPVDGGNV
jgi:hypothetical protein